MRHTASCAQLRPGQHGVNQLVGVQAALHDDFYVTTGRQFGSLLCGGVAVRHRDDLSLAQVDVVLRSQVANAHLGTNQYRDDKAVGRSIHSTAKRFNIARVNHGATHGFHAFGQSQQVLEARLRIKQLDLGGVHLG